MAGIQGLLDSIKKKAKQPRKREEAGRGFSFPKLEFEDPGTINRIWGVLIVFFALIVIASIVGAFSGHQGQDHSLGIPKFTAAQSVDGKTGYVQWTKVDGADGYELYICDTLDGEYSFYAKVNANITKYVFNNLEMKTYYIKIDATNGNDMGQLSEAITLVPVQGEQPQLSTYVSSTDISVLLPYAQDVQTYEILKSVNGGEFNSVYNGAARVYSDTDIKEGVNYQYKTVIHFSFGAIESAPSEVVKYQNPAKITSGEEEENTSGTGRTSEEVLKAKKSEKESGQAIKIFIDSDEAPALAGISDYTTPSTYPVDSVKISSGAANGAANRTEIVNIAGESYVVKVGPDESAIESAVEAYINELHSVNDEYAVDHDDALAAAARVRAREIAFSFSHKRPDGSGLWTLLDGYEDYDSYLGQNIVGGVGSAKEIFAAMYNDSSLRANILDPEYDRIGVGVYYAGEGMGLYAVILFAD